MKINKYIPILLSIIALTACGGDVINSSSDNSSTPNDSSSDTSSESTPKYTLIDHYDAFDLKDILPQQLQNGEITLPRQAQIFIKSEVHGLDTGAGYESHGVDINEVAYNLDTSSGYYKMTKDLMENKHTYEEAGQYLWYENGETYLATVKINGTSINKYYVTKKQTYEEHAVMFGQVPIYGMAVTTLTSNCYEMIGNLVGNIEAYQDEAIVKELFNVPLENVSVSEEYKMYDELSYDLSNSIAVNDVPYHDQNKNYNQNILTENNIVVENGLFKAINVDVKKELEPNPDELYITLNQTMTGASEFSYEFVKPDLSDFIYRGELA